MHHLARFSFLAADPGIVVRSKGPVTEVGEAGSWRREEGDALAVVRRLLAGWAAEPVAGLPPFQGGAAGYIGYDFGSVLERLPAPRYDDLAIPDVVLGLYDWVIAWDHRIGTAWLISTGAPAKGEMRARRRGRAPGDWCRETGPSGGRVSIARRALARPRSLRARHPTRCTGIEGAEAIGLRSTFTHRGYLDAVARVREYIVAGDIFQANLSQRFQAPLREAPVRALSPAAAPQSRAVRRLSRLRASSRSLSASPERFLRLDEKRPPGRDPADQGNPTPRARPDARCGAWAARWPRARRTGPRT